MYNEIFRSFVALFVIMDPIGNIPIFLSLTRGLPRKEVAKTMSRAIIVAALILFAFLFFGLEIFNFFGITTEAFLVAGGLVLLIIGIMYVFGAKFKRDSGDIASVPIGTPLLTGPGVITSTVILVSEYGQWVVFVAAVFTLLFSWIIIENAHQLYKVFGHRWVNAVSRIMGLILAAIAVEFMRKGILAMIG